MKKSNLGPVAVKLSRDDVNALSFYEDCELIGIEKPNFPADLKVSSFRDMERSEQTQIMMQLSDIQKHFNRYLQVGGFPELPSHHEYDPHRERSKCIQKQA